MEEENISMSSETKENGEEINESIEDNGAIDQELNENVSLDESDEEKSDADQEKSEDDQEKSDNDQENSENEDEKLELTDDSIAEEDHKESKEEEDEEHSGLFDMPPEVSGKRDRKKTERLEYEVKKEEAEPEGLGTPLKEIAYAEYMLSKASAEELKVFHRIAYNRPGTQNEIKKNLRKFRGFPFTKDDKAYDRKKQIIDKLNMADLKKILYIFGAKGNGVKSEICERLMKLLMCPEDLGKNPPTRKGKSSKPKGKKQKKPTTSKPKVVESKEEDSSNGETEQPVKKITKKPAKSVEKKEKKTPMKRKRPNEEEEETPKPKSQKLSPPTDAQIKKFVEKLLAEANLEEVTMKKVCQQVYSKYPKHDLTHKKEFIKDTVKTIIS